MITHSKKKFKPGDLCIAVNPLVLSFSAYVLILERIYRYSSGQNKKGEHAYRCLTYDSIKIVSESNLRKI